MPGPTQPAGQDGISRLCAGEVVLSWPLMPCAEWRAVLVLRESLAFCCLLLKCRHPQYGCHYPSSLSALYSHPGFGCSATQMTVKIQTWISVKIPPVLVLTLVLLNSRFTSSHSSNIMLDIFTWVSRWWENRITSKPNTCFFHRSLLCLGFLFLSSRAWNHPSTPTLRREMKPRSSFLVQLTWHFLCEFALTVQLRHYLHICLHHCSTLFKTLLWRLSYCVFYYSYTCVLFPTLVVESKNA